ncbi:hypothetical protein Trydic_g8694 [Trypoxylus dichotomus]
MDTTLQFLQLFKLHFIELIDSEYPIPQEDPEEYLEKESRPFTLEDAGILDMKYKEDAVNYWKGGKRKRLSVESVQRRFRKRNTGSGTGNTSAYHHHHRRLQKCKRRGLVTRCVPLARTGHEQDKKSTLTNARSYHVIIRDRSSPQLLDLSRRRCTRKESSSSSPSPRAP